MEFNKTKVVEALTKVMVPGKNQDLISLNMVRDLEISGNNISFTLELPTMTMPGKEDLNFACMEAVQDVYPTAQVHVHMMALNRQAPPARNSMPQVRNIIAVASGKGGVGKSTVSVNLALGLQKLGARVGLIDADLYGPSIPTMLGLQGQRPQVREMDGGHKIVPLQAYGLNVMSIGFIIEPEQAVVLRGPRLAAIIKQFFRDCLWPELDYLVVDLPPGTGDIQLTLVQTVSVTGAVLVTTPQQVAIADAIKAMNMFLLPSVDVPILGVVENMSWFTPKELPDNKYFIFGEGGGKEMAKLSKSVLLGQVPLIQGIREAGDQGLPAILREDEPTLGAFFEKIAKQTAIQVAMRNESRPPTPVVNVKL
ncbi:MAG: Mrp/NBP35 family ATP-binding protein [Bacteroidota bacterium]